MGNLAGNNIGLNYKGLLNLENLNTNMAARQTITDGENVNSCLRLGVADAVFTGKVGFGADITPTAFVHARAINAYDYLYRATDLGGDSIFEIREGVTNTESVFSKYGFMSSNAGDGGGFDIAGFGTALKGYYLQLYSGAFLKVNQPTDGFAMGIGSTCVSVHPSALLDMQSITKGLLPPRMTAEQASAITAADGLILYVIDTDATFTSVGLWCYEAGVWVKL